MTRKEFRELIKEEIRNTLRENSATRLYKVEGKLITNTNIKTQTQILSDIRSITGITTIDSNEYTPASAKPGYQYDVLTVKIDPYPYLRATNEFNESNIQQIIDNIKKIKGVVAFKAEPKLLNIGI